MMAIQQLARTAWAALPASIQAAALMLVAMIFFTSMSVFIRLAAESVHSLEVVFFRNFLALLILMPWLLHRGPGVLRTRRLGLYSSRAILNVLAMAAGFTALTLIPLAEATALGFTTPLFATIGAVLLLGEVIRIRRISALVIGFIGVLIVLRPGFETIGTGSLLALISALLLAITTLVVKRLTATENPESIVAWMALMQSPLSLLPALWVWQWPGPLTWLWLFCLAGAGTIGHLCWTRAYAIAEVSALQPFEFLKLPLIGWFAYLAFAELPSVWTWIGGVVIFSATAYISIREAQLAKSQPARQDSTAN